MHIFLCCFLYSFLFLSLRQTCSWFRPTSLLDPFFLCVYPSATGRNCLSSVSFAQYGCLCPAALFFSLPHVPILRVYFFCLSSGFFLLPKRWSRFKVVGWLFFFLHQFCFCLVWICWICWILFFWPSEKKITPSKSNPQAKPACVLFLPILFTPFSFVFYSYSTCFFIASFLWFLRGPVYLVLSGGLCFVLYCIIPPMKVLTNC